jgi:hypothetical protein
MRCDGNYARPGRLKLEVSAHLKYPFSEKFSSGGITRPELSEMWKPHIYTTRKRVDFPEVPSLSIPMRQWGQVQPVFWGDQDIHDTETIELQRFLRKL